MGDFVHIDEEVAGKPWIVGQVVRLPAILRAFGNAKENELAVRMLNRPSTSSPVCRLPALAYDLGLTRT